METIQAILAVCGGISVIGGAVAVAVWQNKPATVKSSPADGAADAGYV